jgi:hypothetical protein
MIRALGIFFLNGGIIPLLGQILDPLSGSYGDGETIPLYCRTPTSVVRRCKTDRILDPLSGCYGDGEQLLCIQESHLCCRKMQPTKSLIPWLVVVVMGLSLISLLTTTGREENTITCKDQGSKHN